MQKTLIILSIFLFSAFALPGNMDDLRHLWTSWKLRHNKGYGVGEDLARFGIFLENYQMITKFNAENANTKLALNKFADLTSEEFSALYASDLLTSQKSIRQSRETKSQKVANLPEYVDWREAGAVTPVINQGQCGSSWATPITGTIEALYKVKTGQLKALSIQQLLECDTQSYGCNGGFLDKGFEYIAKYGIETESDYPYTAQNGTIGKCQYDHTKANFNVSIGYKNIQYRSSDSLKAALVQSPVATPIEADDQVFQFYSAGVITKGCRAIYVNHGAFTVGYKTLGGIEAFILKNSWGQEWGQKGYAYISTDESVNGGLGNCGILSGPIAPIPPA